MLTIRDHYPLREAHWRVPFLLLFSGSGMATGGWLAGYLYDFYGYYMPAFATGVAFNIVNIIILCDAAGAAAHLRDRDALRASALARHAALHRIGERLIGDAAVRRPCGSRSRSIALSRSSSPATAVRWQRRPVQPARC